MKHSSISSEAKRILLKNRRIASGQQFTVNGKTSNQQFLDSCLASISLTNIEPKAAEKEVISLAALQLSDGKIPRSKRSALIEPPLIAYSALEIFRSSRSEEFLEKIFSKLDRYYKWISAIRDPRSENLVSIIHPDESSYGQSNYWDNFDSKSLLSFYESMENNDSMFLSKGYFDVKDLLFNCIYLESLKSMTEICKIVGRETSFYKRKYEYTKQEIRNRMYDKTAKLFFSLYGSSKIDIVTPAIFMPLFSNVLTHSEATYLVNRYLFNSQEFWTEYPVPTAPFSNKNFDSGAYWRGSAQMSINWFIFRGLLNYKMVEAAEDLYERSLAMLKNGFFEYYNSINGDGLGAKDYTSPCLILNMMQSENLF